VRDLNEMSLRSYYTGRPARYYNTLWRTYTRRTLAEVQAAIDFSALYGIPQRLGRSPRVLDVACGTGVLLKWLCEHIPGVEAYGVDASADMLEQAGAALKDQPHVHLERAEVGAGETAHLPYAPGTFDLITFTNAMHDLLEPAATLRGLKRLLAPGGQLVMEDFARREPPFPWKAFEWVLRRAEGGQVHAFTLDEVQSLCEQTGLRVSCSKAFQVNRLWRAWVLRASTSGTCA
jgi:ubiquinone/menaquinone biosynthesis C-methylase UbiE